MKVLGIETSCDETGIAVYDTEHGLLAHQLHSQIALHAEYGGVVPELASRDHIRKALPLIEAALQQANIDKRDIDGIAYTAGPGLVGALMVGAAIAQGLALAWNIPVIGVHHMEAHLLAPWLEADHPEPPFIALLVSGGHTQLIQVTDLGKYKLLGESIDDAAGEAFDKTAKVLGLAYPGGPELAKLAEQGKPDTFNLPRPMTDRPGLDFSFSGLKTAAINTLSAHCKTSSQKPAGLSSRAQLNHLSELQQVDQQTKADLARAFQDAVVDTLLIKCQRALQQTGLKTLVIAGGVSANKHLRTEMSRLAEKNSWNVFYPRHEFCTDNGAMIALAGALRLQQGQKSDDGISVRARWPLTEL